MELKAETVQDILQFFRDVQQQVRICTDDQKACEDQTMDCLHELELVDNSYHEQARIARKIADIRKKRREAKDTIELLTPLTEWISTNQAAVKGLERALGKMRDIDTKRENRLYYYRADGNYGLVIK